MSSVSVSAPAITLSDSSADKAILSVSPFDTSISGASASSWSVTSDITPSSSSSDRAILSSSISLSKKSDGTSSTVSGPLCSESASDSSANMLSMSSISGSSREKSSDDNISSTQGEFDSTVPASIAGLTIRLSLVVFVDLDEKSVTSLSKLPSNGSNSNSSVFVLSIFLYNRG